MAMNQLATRYDDTLNRSVVEIDQQTLPSQYFAQSRESLRNLPYLGCSYRASFMLIKILATIEDTVLISHSSIGCDSDWIYANQHYHSLLRSKGLPLRNANLMSTNLTEEDVIFGADDKLEKAVEKAMSTYHPQAIFIRAKCCTPGRSPYEMQELIEHIQRRYSIPILLARCDFISKVAGEKRHHKEDYIRSSWGKIFQASVPDDAPIFNLINFTDDDSFRDLLKSGGAQWNYLSYGSPFASFEKAAKAKATIQYSTVEFGEYLGEMFRRELGVPYCRVPAPYGISATDAALTVIGEIVANEEDFQKLIFLQKQKYQPLIEELRHNLHSLRCLPVMADFGGEERCMLAMLKDLGLTILGDQREGREYDTVLSNEKRITTFYGENGLHFGDHGGYKLINFIREEAPDVLIVHHNGLATWSMRMGIPTIELGDVRGGLDFLGYSGLVRLGRKILDTVTNPALTKQLSKHTGIPYSYGWMNQPLVQEVIPR
ncbi:MAG TPA: hypothetical protein DDW65_13830 [Firmicutes bacterium]|jgi:nitrogenase molybdenum-iron protein alpha chain|nr:hypothetical protein [Bacillota bacterium]